MNKMTRTSIKQQNYTVSAAPGQCPMLVLMGYSRRVGAARRRRWAETPARCSGATGAARSAAGTTWPGRQQASAPPPPAHRTGRGRTRADWRPRPRRRPARRLRTSERVSDPARGGERYLPASTLTTEPTLIYSSGQRLGRGSVKKVASYDVQRQRRLATAVIL